MASVTATSSPGLARAFEIAGGIKVLNDAGYDSRLQKTLEEDPNLIGLAIWPVSGELHRAFQPDVYSTCGSSISASARCWRRMNGRGIVVSRPQIIRSGQEMALTVAAPVMGGEWSGCCGRGGCDRFVSGSFQGRASANLKSERELLDAGLPVVFVVDQNGRAVAHPEASVAFSEKPMTELKVVQDWQESGAQVQSALEPFTGPRRPKSRNAWVICYC